MLEMTVMNVSLLTNHAREGEHPWASCARVDARLREHGRCVGKYDAYPFADVAFTLMVRATIRVSALRRSPAFMTSRCTWSVMPG